MPKIDFPYGKEYMSFDIPQNRLQAVLVSKLHGYTPPKGEIELVQDALLHPVGTPRLAEMVKGRNKVVLIASDHTRPVPSKVIIPQMLSEIRLGNPDSDITILVATGCHRETTKEELISKFGEEIVKNEKIVVHDCDDAENLVSLGKLPSGGELIVNRIAVEADFLCSEGFIEPHFFAGFSGGRKSVLPGIAARKTVLANHCAAFIADPNARTGVLENNPIHCDMLYAARRARLDFIVNVVLDENKKVIHAVAGDCDLAHRKGTAFLDHFCKVDAAPADIVITTNGGYPLDQNVYQAVKGMTAAEATVNQAGVIIMLAKSADGHGGEKFYETFRDEQNLNLLMQKFLATPAEETIPDQWQSQIFARVMQRAKVIYISDLPDEMIYDLQMIPAHSIQEALEMAEELVDDEKALITAIPDGVSVVVQKV